ncbi:hypothetical protein BDF14DRAFT_1742189 [Spinellus fusiger]|nr:hypothetical protein BDF14DRAFT_1742189 [Spinellus fusiger]
MRHRSSSASDAYQSQKIFSTARLSQHITDIVSPWLKPSQPSLEEASPSPPVSSPPIATPPLLNVCLDEPHTVLRPNHVYRGTVILTNTRSIYASSLRIELRGEEFATVKLRDGVEAKVNRIDQTKITYFNVHFHLWGESSGVKIPNVNFPPSVEAPSGFAVRYFWTARLMGPASSPDIASKEYTVPYCPTLCAPLPEPWEYKDTLYKDKKALANVSMTFPRHVFCPEETIKGNLDIKAIPSNAVVSGVFFVLQKTTQGRKMFQTGTVRSSETVEILNESIPVHGNDGSLQLRFQIQLPVGGVLPCFQSKHIRIYYSLTVTLKVEYLKSLLKSSGTHSVAFTLPLSIGNLAYENMLTVPDITSLRDYQHSNEGPEFFDPSLEAPPRPPMHPEWGPLTAAQASPPAGAPPNYFSLPQLPQAGQSRKEQVIETSRFVKLGAVPGLEPMCVDANDDGEW